MERQDIIQNRMLEQTHDVETACVLFYNISCIMHDFFKEKLLTKDNLIKYDLSQEIFEKAIISVEMMKQYLENKISNSDLRKYKFDAWDQCDRHDGNNSLLFRVIVCGLCDRDAYEKSLEDAPHNIFISVFFSLYKLNPDLCETFKIFVQNHPLMEKYRLK